MLRESSPWKLNQSCSERFCSFFHHFILPLSLCLFNEYTRYYIEQFDLLIHERCDIINERKIKQEERMINYTKQSDFNFIVRFWNFFSVVFHFN